MNLQIGNVGWELIRYVSFEIVFAEINTKLLRRSMRGERFELWGVMTVIFVDEMR